MVGWKDYSVISQAMQEYLLSISPEIRCGIFIIENNPDTLDNKGQKLSELGNGLARLWTLELWTKLDNRKRVDTAKIEAACTARLDARASVVKWMRGNGICEDIARMTIERMTDAQVNSMISSGNLGKLS